jgi:nicotinate-nucleotide pyrophosphorylase (carboxylating)
VLDLDALPLEGLFEALTGDGSLARLLRAARDEDLGGGGDVTTASIVPAGATARAHLVARAGGIACGLRAVPAVLEAFAARAVRWSPSSADGSRCRAGEALGVIEGDLAAILALERTLLNLVGHLGGVATATRAFVDAAAGTRAAICATRKTTPGLRGLEKYAVRCGGGTLHRLGLHDAALYKDNHLAGVAPTRLAAVLTAAVRAARRSPLRFVEVEVDDLAQLRAVLAIEPGLVDMVLLDNMPPALLAEAVAIRDEIAPRVLLEASGGVRIDTVSAIAATGVDRISVGAITHSAPALDVALDVEAPRRPGRSQGRS